MSPRCHRRHFGSFFSPVMGLAGNISECFLKEESDVTDSPKEFCNFFPLKPSRSASPIIISNQSILLVPQLILAICHFVRREFIFPRFVKFPPLKSSMNWGRWHTSVEPVFGKLKQENHEVKVGQDNLPRTHLENEKKPRPTACLVAGAFLLLMFRLTADSLCGILLIWILLPCFALLGQPCVFPLWGWGWSWLPFSSVIFSISSMTSSSIPCIPNQMRVLHPV